MNKMVLGSTEDSQPALPRATDEQDYSLSFDVYIQEDSLGLVPLITIQHVWNGQGWKFVYAYVLIFSFQVIPVRDSKEYLV